MQAPDSWPAAKTEMRATDSLVPYARNARTHTPAQVAQIMASMREFGVTVPALVDEEDGIIAGHGRILAAKELALPEFPVMVARGWTEAQKRAYVIADNKLALNSGWDEALLGAEIRDLQAGGYDVGLVGFSGEELAAFLASDAGSGGPNQEPDPPGAEGKTGAGSLAAKFGISPFTVLNAREGWWQDRKRAWLALGIASELGRGAGGTDGDAAPGGSLMPAMDYSDRSRGDGKGRKVNVVPGGGNPMPHDRAKPPRANARAFDRDMMKGETVNFQGQLQGPSISGHTYGISTGAYDQRAGEETPPASSGTSIFDPVLCELAYRWFSPPGGLILDPFAGGSVRGIVAARLGRGYVGVDLRPEQVEANRVQAAAICGEVQPAWHVGDSLEVIPGLDVAADFIFSCPPYGDLEVYSERPGDLSNMDHRSFVAAYRKIIAAAVAKLKPNAFACFVVGDFRDRKGFYRDFVSDTIGAFVSAGARLYNEAILVTAVGSLALRAGRQFEASRKLGKAHQNVLVFCKGDPTKATKAVGAVEFRDPAEGEEPPPPDEAPPAAAEGDARFGDLL